MLAWVRRSMVGFLIQVWLPGRVQLVITLGRICVLFIISLRLNKIYIVFPK